ncbi:hypothetical protein ACFL96_08340 [Thermoproteota archaeon]
MKIAVYGSALGDSTKEIREKARELGREIAKKGHIIITGGCPGLPYEAVIGAKEKGGKTIAFSPGVDIEEQKSIGFPVEGFDEFVFVPKDFSNVDDVSASGQDSNYKGNVRIAGKYRNVMSTASCDAGIIVGGQIGSLNEFTCLYDLGKNIGVLTGTGGTADMIRNIVETLNKPTKSKIVYESDPAKLIQELEKLEKEVNK